MIITTPNKVENRKCLEITIDHLRSGNLTPLIMTRMIDLCINSPGVGLAAPQVDLPYKFFVAYDPPSWKLFANPQYSTPLRDVVYSVEACLTYGKDNKYRVKRDKSIIATWDEVDFEHKILTRRMAVMDGIRSIIFQHETDHCNGITIAMIGEKC